MTIIDLINESERSLQASGAETPLLDAEVLISHVLNCERVDLYIQRNKIPDENEAGLISGLIDRRINGEPVAYITGTKEFWSIPIIVNNDVLVPRPETEFIVETALGKVANQRDRINVLDLCTGSGCIVAALAKELPNASFTATDISKSALAVAEKNLSFASDRTTLLQGDLFSALPDKNRGFDIITANPPYIPTGDIEKLSRDIRDFEPVGALIAEKCGLDFIERIIKDAPSYLKSGGSLIIEFGIGQANEIRSMAAKNSDYNKIEVYYDLAGIERIAHIGMK
jgi:release factor glutamine methyltransferase